MWFVSSKEGTNHICTLKGKIMVKISQMQKRDFSGGPVVKTLLPMQGMGFDPWLGN